MRSAAVVFNPAAGRGGAPARLARVLEALEGAGFNAGPLPTRAPGDATNRAREAVDHGAEVVFSLGGDGTLRECAAGLLGSKVPLAFLPTGTINVMALELGVPSRPVAAARSYARAEPRRFGVGMAGETPFLMQASAGVDAFLIASMRSKEKKLLGRLSPIPALLRTLARYRFPVFTVSTSAGSRAVTLAVASNVKRYGGPWKLTPEARSDGETLELFSFAGRGRAAAIGLALSVIVGRQLKLAGSRSERVTRATLQPVPRLPFQVDGDVFEASRDRSFEIQPSDPGIHILVPTG